ncbi:hypothetical protein HK405_008291 [Cladochytrium tenue]|nr:hypothetical protein HK405_008291 [Cladochytrium tenue]
MRLPFLTLDVFTATPYEGNPLGVVLVPAGLSPALASAQKQAIAREFNLSETVFVHLPAQPAAPADDEDTAATVPIDIFMTTRELPFAGHPTIGAACFVLGLLNLAPSATLPQPPRARPTATLLAKAGPIPITAGPAAGFALASIPHNVHIHAHTPSALPPDAGLVLNPHPDIAAAELAAPVVSIVLGMSFLLVRLPSLDLLAQTRMLPNAALQGLLDPDWAVGFVGRFYYVVTPSDVDADRDAAAMPSLTIRARMMAESLEDPATGSASCALASYLALTGTVAHGAIGAPSASYEITQGVEMGRRSVIRVDVGVDRSGEEGKITSVQLGGQAVLVMEGTLEVPPV